MKRRGKVVEIICSCKDESEAEQMEKHFIKFFWPDRAIGLAGRGRKHSDTTRLKMSLSHDRKPRFTGKHSEETKAKMRAGQRAYQERRRIKNES